MTVTVQIETNTAAGQKLISELRRHPDVVRFVAPDQISEPVPEGYVPVIDDSSKLVGLITESSLLIVLSNQYINQEDEA